jgi:hypothetical protein
MKFFLLCFALLTTFSASAGVETFDYNCKYISSTGKTVFDTSCNVEVVTFGADGDIQYTFSFTSKSKVTIYQAYNGQNTTNVNGLAATVVDIDNGIVAVTLEGTGAGEAFVLTY